MPMCMRCIAEEILIEPVAGSVPIYELTKQNAL